MYPAIRISSAAVFLCLSVLTVSARPGSVKPVRVNLIRKVQIEKLNALLSDPLVVQNVSRESKDPGQSGRICSCQILDLISRNYHHDRVVLLAEKTNHGGTSDYAVARKRIIREKKQLKQMFYDKVKLVAKTQTNGSCQSLYVRLKSADNRLQLYEILNADTSF